MPGGVVDDEVTVGGVGSAGGRPVSDDAEEYKNRNVVERFFHRMKNWRGLASRYDKYARVYRGGVVLAAILDWLTSLVRRALAP